jgi:hypothetical protein
VTLSNTSESPLTLFASHNRIPVLSIPYRPNRFAVPEYPKPPTGDFDPDGLRKRIDYAKGIRKRRDISGRLLAFISKYKDQCSRALRLQKKSREELLNTIKIDEGELWSRWEEVHGSDGIIVVFRNSTAAMMEMRLAIEYGDVLGEACKQLKSSHMNNLSLEWKAYPEMDWMAVVTAIRADIEKINAYRASCDRGDEPKEYPKVPWRRSCEEAASKLGTTPDQIEWEITHYAKRNSLCHQGIGDMIARCQWESLGKQLLDDKPRP